MGYKNLNWHCSLSKSFTKEKAVHTKQIVLISSDVQSVLIEWLNSLRNWIDQWGEMWSKLKIRKIMRQPHIHIISSTAKYQLDVACLGTIYCRWITHMRQVLSDNQVFHKSKGMPAELHGVWILNSFNRLKRSADYVCHKHSSTLMFTTTRRMCILR